MKRENKKFFCGIAVFLAFVIAFASQGAMIAPLAVSEKSNYAENNDSITGDTIIPVSGNISSDDIDDLTGISDSDYITENNDSGSQTENKPSTDSSISEDEILPDSGGTVITENPEKNEEKDGVVIIPIEPNNIIRDSLPSIITENVYTFSVSKRGVMMYSFNHTGTASANCQWYITLYEEYSPDGSGKTTDYREMYRLSYANLGTTAVSSLLGVLPGNYRISVACVSGYSSNKYDFAVGFAQSNDYETECNDTINRYSELPLNKTVNGSASVYTGDKMDTDWYMFEVTEKGYSVLYFDHAADQSGTSTSAVAWRIQITDIEGNEYYYTTSSMGATSLNSGVIGLTPGYYFVTIYSHVVSGMTYSLSVSFSADNNIERELNETPETATPIGINTEMVGSLSERDGESDKDYYSFTLDKDGFVVIDFIHEALSEAHDGWNVSIVSADGTVAYKSVSDWTQNTLMSPYIGLDAGTYYIRIDSDNIYRSSIVYRLLLLTVQDGSWESEPNNSIATADEIAMGTSVNGTMIENGVEYDTDYFALDITEESQIKVSFSHITFAEPDKEGWVIKLTDKDGNILKGMASDWNEEEKSFIPDSLAPGRYYIIIETGLYFNDSRYLLTLSQP